MSQVSCRDHNASGILFHENSCAPCSAELPDPARFSTAGHQKYLGKRKPGFTIRLLETMECYIEFCCHNETESWFVTIFPAFNCRFFFFLHSELKFTFRIIPPPHGIGSDSPTCECTCFKKICLNLSYQKASHDLINIGYRGYHTPIKLPILRYFLCFAIY